MRFVLTFLFFTGLYFHGICQKYSFVNYSTNEGLPQSQVTAITQDSDDYLWIGTLGGLTKFNGKDFVTYSSESGLFNNSISFLTIIDGELWIGHKGGISCLTKSKFITWALPIDDVDIYVRCIVKFQNKIVVATQGDGIFTLEKNKLKKSAINNDDNKNVRDLLVYNNSLFLATKYGAFITNDLKSSSAISELYDHNIQAVEIRGNKVLISTSDQGLYSYDIYKKKVEQIHLKNKLLELKKVFVDSKNSCWITTDSGVLFLDKDNHEKLIDESKGLPVGVISSVFEDDIGNMWFGSSSKGLLRFPGEKFVYYNQSNGLSSDAVMSVNQDKYGALWFGTFDKGLVSLTQKKEFKYINLPNDRVWASVMNVNGFNWFATDEGLIQVSLNGSIKAFNDQNIMPGVDVTALYKVGANLMYIGGSEGVSVYRNGKFYLLNGSRKADIGRVRSLLLYNKQLFCGTSKGLYIYNNRKFIKVLKIKKAVYSILKDGRGNLWIGTNEGLFIYKNGTVKQLVFSSSQTSNIINFLNYKKGKIFVGTNNGLYVLSNFHNKKLYSISHFGVDDGIVDIETNINSSFFDKNNSFWFGTSTGLVKFDGWEEDFHPVTPKINLKLILLNYETFDYLKYSEKLNKNGLPIRMSLPYFKNNITFEIDGISLSNYAELDYQFWLEGYDEKWSPKNKNKLISFTGLRAGEYVFHARTINENKIASNEIYISFEVKQPFYKSWWFILLLILILLFISYQLFKFKLKRETEKSQNEMIEYKSKLMSLEQKSLNASMNRHFIFNSLNSIQYFINSQDRLSANRYLTNFAKLIRKNLDSTNEEGNMITLKQELEGLELYLSLESMRFKDRFHYKIDCVEVDTESVILPAMLLQPFIENSIIHGILPIEDKKGFISILVTKDENILTIQIDDNGIGIKNSLKLKENSIGDHRSQGMEITAKRIDLIKKISNKGFDIIGPIQINETDISINGTRVLLKIPFENLED